MESTGKGRQILHLRGRLVHQTFPVINGDLCISESEENVSKADLLRILASLAHDLSESEGFFQVEIRSSPLIRQV